MRRRLRNQINPRYLPGGKRSQQITTRNDDLFPCEYLVRLKFIYNAPDRLRVTLNEFLDGPIGLMDVYFQMMCHVIHKISKG